MTMLEWLQAQTFYDKALDVGKQDVLGMFGKKSTWHRKGMVTHRSNKSTMWMDKDHVMGIVT